MINKNDILEHTGFIILKEKKLFIHIIYVSQKDVISDVIVIYLCI